MLFTESCKPDQPQTGKQHIVRRRFRHRTAQIVIHRYRTRIRERATIENTGTLIERNTGQSENIPPKYSSGTVCGGAADIPVEFGARAYIKLNGNHRVP